ncbi:cell division protein FtsH, partial [Deinococcus petrolearius]
MTTRLARHLLLGALLSAPALAQAGPGSGGTGPGVSPPVTSAPGPVSPGAVPAGPYTTNQFFQNIRSGQVSGVTLDSAGNAQVTVRGALRPRTLVLPTDAATIERIRAAGVPLRVVAGGSAFGWVGQVLPLILTGLLLLLLWRSLRGPQGGNGPTSFGKSKAAIVSEGQIKLSFAD